MVAALWFIEDSFVPALFALPTKASVCESVLREWLIGCT